MTVQPAVSQRADRGRRRAAGIYGAIVTAAILDVAGGHVSTVALSVSVIVTLTAVALALGVVMILLKDLVLVHLH